MILDEKQLKEYLKGHGECENYNCSFVGLIATCLKLWKVARAADVVDKEAENFPAEVALFVSQQLHNPLVALNLPSAPHHPPIVGPE